MNGTFKSMLERIKKKLRYVPIYRGLCTYLVGSNGPIIVDNDSNVLDYVMSIGD